MSPEVWLPFFMSGRTPGGANHEGEEPMVCAMAPGLGAMVLGQSNYSLLDAAYGIAMKQSYDHGNVEPRNLNNGT